MMKNLLKKFNKPNDNDEAEPIDSFDEAGGEQNTVAGERVCKSCGRPLPADWRFRRCEACRRNIADKVKPAAVALGTVTVFAAKKYGPKLVQAAVKIVIKK